MVEKPAIQNGGPTNGHLLNGKVVGQTKAPTAPKKVAVAFADPDPPGKESKEDAKPTRKVRVVERRIEPPVKKGKPLPPRGPFGKLLEIFGCLEPRPEKADLEPDLKIRDPMVILGCLRFKTEWVVKPESTNYYCWLTLVSVVVMYNILMLALRAVFIELNEDDDIASLMVADYIGDIINFLDIFVNMFSGHLSDELVMVEEPRKLFTYWIRTTNGKLDIISVLPTDLAFIWTGIGIPYAAVRFNRFLKYHKLAEYLHRTEGRVPDPQLVRLFSVMLKFFLLIHLNACLYYFISEKVGLNSDGWVYPGEAKWRKTGVNETNADDSLLTKYTWSFYWSFHTLTMIGITQQPQTEWQFLFLTFQFVAGVMLFSQILGNTIQTVLKATAEARKFRNKIDITMQYLEMRNISPEIRQKVTDYFEYQWIQKRLIDDKEALESLPEKLEADLAIKVHLATLKHVRIFQGVEPGLLVDLVLKLELQVFAPGEYVCRKGDIGRELYIIKKGCLEVVSDDGSFVFARLGEGSVFGEISILNMKGIKSGNRRTANVRSIGYADLFVLSKHDLWLALEEYPEGKNKILELGRQILLKDNLINLVEEEKLHREHQRFLDKLIKVEWGVADVQLRFGRLTAEHGAVMFKLKQRIAQLERLIELEDDRERVARGEPSRIPIRVILPVDSAAEAAAKVALPVAKSGKRKNQPVSRVAARKR